MRVRAALGEVRTTVLVSGSASTVSFCAGSGALPGSSVSLVTISAMSVATALFSVITSVFDAGGTSSAAISFSIRRRFSA